MSQPRKKHVVEREQRVVTTLQKCGAMTIDELARAVFARQRPFAKAKSCVRNALRVPRKLGLVKQLGGGKYQAAQQP